ncbi:hypothetical protein DFQ27_001984 [Actinomortierella ambigua]|uniref:Transmembrane protein n=1 Tax=Actinomortierella ambigua TaxID=1343610 RepID=A0A9P6U6U2_9FUNG|nr:hypothetical protein DFQ27_001984 [Actinomortierella ambigua]
MKSLTRTLALVLLLNMALLSHKTFQVKGQECTINCAGFFTKALFCQNKDRFDIPVDIPTIGQDPVVDNYTCAACRARNGITPYDVTWTFINACNALYPNRQLFLSPGNAASRITHPFSFSAHGPQQSSLQPRPRPAFVSFVLSSASLVLLAMTVGLTVLVDLLTT